jgi:uncharacterized protein YndB with AHSA1/START domain
MTFDTIVTKSIAINAPASKIWQTLTSSDLVKRWLTDSALDVVSDWQVGSPINYYGNWHGVEYRDKGTILQFEPEKRLQYSNWSEVSGTADIPENYTIIEFRLLSEGDHILLTVTHSNFATEVMYKHVNFYWNVTIHKIKRLIEQVQ